MYTITGCKHQQPLQSECKLHEYAVVHGYVYISAVAIYSLEDIIEMHIHAYACSSLLVSELLLSIVSSIVLPDTLVPGSTNMLHRYFCM